MEKQMELCRIERPFIAYSLCFDDVMRTYLHREGIPYSEGFGSCWEFKYNGKCENISHAVEFPSVGYGKYSALGIHVTKKPIKNTKVACNAILSLLEKEKVVPFHYDGFYCPWDTMQKKRRWHNFHTVLVRAIDKRGKNWIADDPYYIVKDKKIPLSAMGAASKFYLEIDVSDYRPRSADEIFQSALNKMLNDSPIEQMERFLHDLKEWGIANENRLFDEKWLRAMENGYMTRHYLWLFFRELQNETRNDCCGILSLLFFGDLQLWKECVVHSLKGNGRMEKRERFVQFTQTFSAVIEKEKEIYNFVKNGKCAKNYALISSCEVGEVKDYKNIDLLPFFNARACKRSKRDIEHADITGEGEYILPKKKFCKRIAFKNIPFCTWAGQAKDHMRCEGQEIAISDSEKWKGIAFLVCSEWGRSQFMVKMKGKEKEYLSDFIANDFTYRSSHSVKIGKSYLIGTNKDVLFQKKIYLQCVYFVFPANESIDKITMPQCPSAHVFSAVLLR